MKFQPYVASSALLLAVACSGTSNDATPDLGLTTGSGGGSGGDTSAGGVSPTPGNPAPGAPSGSGGGSTGAPGSSDGGGAGGSCGSLAGPNVTAGCNSCGSHTCQPNGCYGGWYCNTTTNKCQAPPASCGGNGGGSGGSGGAYDGGTPVTGTVGSNGGTVSRLLFTIVGDTRPATIDDTAAYPTAVIDGIYTRMQGLNPLPPFGVSTGDYMFASTSGSESAPQLDMYIAARSKFSGVMFPAMGNHECTGATVSNCGSGSTNGVTTNYSNFLSKMLAPLGKSEPYYSIEVDAADGSWTAKVLFVAANAWDSTQASWLQSAMAKPTTYTFVIRHEPAGTSGGPPGVSGSEQVMAQYPYTLAIVGHTHTYRKSGAKEIIVGNGGAPLTSSGNYGFGIVSQRPDGALDVDMIDSTTGQADTSFHFAIKADGTPAP